MDPITLATVFTSFIPAVSYAFKRIVDYNTGGSSPSNASEVIEGKKADVEQLKALAALEAIGPVSVWVSNVRALIRPLVVTIVLANWTALTMGLIHVDLQLYVITANIASSVMFYLFGDRSLMYSLQQYNKLLK